MPLRSNLAFLALALSAGAPARAADNAADIAARLAFDRVVTSQAVPDPSAVQDCILRQYDAHRDGAHSKRATLETRRVYCTFLQASATGSSADLALVAQELIAARGSGKSASSPLLKLLADLAKLRAGKSAETLPVDLEDVDCDDAGFAKAPTCLALVNAAYLWTGSLALLANNLPQARQAFNHVPASPWNSWFIALSQAEAGQWNDAAESYSTAAAAWSHPPESLAEWLAPRATPPDLQTLLAQAQYFTGHVDLALPTLDRALAANPTDAMSLLMRARYRESLGLTKPALLDYQAAAPISPFYKGILLTRSHDPAAAAEFDRADPASPDLPAWKSLASPSCADPVAMEKLAAATSPLFPKEELAVKALECRLRSVTKIEDLLTLDPVMRNGPPEIHRRMAAAYIKLGVAAEDKKDAYTAVIAYRRALEWTPDNTKARFNLGAVYIGDQKYDLAEAEYRALLKADLADHEAQYLLAASILSATPTPERKAEACTLLSRSLQIQDAGKRVEFAALAASAGCAN